MPSRFAVVIAISAIGTGIMPTIFTIAMFTIEVGVMPSRLSIAVAISGVRVGVIPTGTTAGIAVHIIEFGVFLGT